MIIIPIVILIASLIVFVVVLETSPEGWEDADGFHLGVRKGRK